MLLLGLPPVLACCLTMVPASGSPVHAYAGRPLIQALQKLEAGGLRLVYSSDLVKTGMIVEAEPTSARPRRILQEILAPHGLAVRGGPGRTLLIVPAGDATSAAGSRGGPQQPGAGRQAGRLRERIVVSSEAGQGQDDRPDAGRTIHGDTLRRTPSLGGDLHRAVAAQPGIASADTSAAISVHGGEPDEMLVLFDGLEIYDPFHLRSFQRFSGIFDAQTVGSAEYFPGGFPVEYGDRMSGVLDLSSSTPEAPGSTMVSSSFLNSRLMTGGTFLEGKGHWLMSGRAWYPDAVVRTTDRENEGFAPSYYDMLGKVQMPLGGRSILTAHFLAARDAVDFRHPEGEESVDAASHNRYSWATLKTLWSPRLYSRTVFSVGRLQSHRDGRLDEAAELTSATVSDQRGFEVVGFGQDWIHRPSDRLLFKWGLGTKWLDAEYLYSSLSTDAGEEKARDIALEPSGRQFGAYIGAQFRPAGPLRVEAGLRWDRQTHTGEAQVSPRLSVVQELGTAGRLRAAWGRYDQSQGIHELQVEDGVAVFSPAQTSEHWSLGYEHRFTGGLVLRADAYRKKMSHLRPRFENLFDPFELLPEFEPDRVRVAPERADAMGVDLSLEMDGPGTFAWWATYSRSSVIDRIDGRSVPRSRDQPHAFRLGMNFRRGDRWNLMLSGIYHTGWPTTAVFPLAVSGPGGTTGFEPVLGPRNGARYPDYARLDLRASRQVPLGRGHMTLFAEITNLTGRDNVCCVEDVTFVPRPDGSVRVDREDGFWMQRVSSIGFAWEFGH